MTSNAALTKEARTTLTDAVSNLRQARELHNATDTRETTWRTKHEAWAARSMVSAVRSITLRHETAGTETSLALQNEITLAFEELVEYAKANRAAHILDVLLGNVYTESETLEIIRAEMVSADETPAPATEEPTAADYKAAASALAEHGLGEGSIPAPATEEDGDGMSWERDLDDAPKHWSYNDVLAAAEYSMSAGCKVAVIELREGDTAVAMGTTKYEHFGPGVVAYYIRPDGVNSRTKCPVRHIRK